MYRQYIAEPDYPKHYEEAVQLSAVYISPLHEIYKALSAGKNLSDQRFSKIVGGADLSCPLNHDILNKAYAELTRRKSDKTRYRALAENGLTTHVNS